MTLVHFNIAGMTCMGCVGHVKEALEGLEGVSGVLVNLSPGTASIQAAQELEIPVIQQALGSKYSVTAWNVAHSKDHINATDQGELSPWKQLTPLYLIFSFIIGGVFLGHFNAVMAGTAQISELMLDFMALFYLVFSFFKFLDLKGFPASFAMYDPLAKRWFFYAKMYPFIELGLGVLLLLRLYVPIVLIVTLVILGLTTVGVLQSLAGKRSIQCACLGTALKLPMTQATFIENALMIVMAVYMLL